MGLFDTHSVVSDAEGKQQLSPVDLHTVGEVLRGVWTVVGRSAVVEEGTIVTAVAGSSYIKGRRVTV